MTRRSAVFDLKVRPVTWDFVTWAVNVRDLGFDHISFDVANLSPIGRKWLNPQQCLQRVDDIFIPAVEALGLTWCKSGTGRRHIGSEHYYHLRPNFQRLESKKKYVATHTVTIRDAQYKQHRNSDPEMWAAFAKAIGALIIPDWTKVPITFADRFAYYAGAEMNWGVTNGPVSTIFLTPYPVRMFCTPQGNRKGMSGHHILPGGQMPFSLPNQDFVWCERITLDALMHEYEKLQRGEKAAVVSCKCHLAGDFSEYWRQTNSGTRL